MCSSWRLGAAGSPKTFKSGAHNIVSFADLGTSKPVVDALRARSITQPFPIQVMTLVATDVAARGIDVADIAQVVNYEAPADREACVHRVGRTGRAGRPGTGISFVLADQAEEMRRITASLGLDGSTGKSKGPVAAEQRRRGRNRRRRRKVAV